MAKRLLNIRDVSKILKIPENRVIDLVEKNRIPAYKIGGEFLRFDPEKIASIKSELQKELGIIEKKPSFLERIKEFIYFYDFYIVSFIIIFILLFYIIRSL